MTFFVWCRRWPRCFAVAGCWVLLLAGCNLEGTVNVGVETELYVSDGLLQTLQRYFFPATYWQEKCAVLQERVQRAQKSFNERTQAYQVLLGKRREQINLAIVRAQAAGKSTDEAQRVVIQEFRALLDPVREEARDQGKELRHAMALLVRAKIATEQ